VSLLTRFARFNVSVYSTSVKLLAAQPKFWITPSVDTLPATNEPVPPVNRLVVLVPVPLAMSVTFVDA